MSWFRKKKSKDTPPADPQAPVDRQAAAADPPPPAPPDPPAGKAGYFSRLRQRLSKTRRNFSDGLERIFFGETQLSSAMLEDLEELLITSDLGVKTSMELISRIGKRPVSGPEALRAQLREALLTMLTAAPRRAAPAAAKPRVIMVVGVNGVGKTTTIGKLAAQAAAGGESVLVAAADTFRAAAIEQLEVWAARAGAELVKHREGADPAAVAYDAVEAAVARGIDTVIVDTAGRLHTKVNLMEELKKIRRSIGKRLPGAPHETLLVLDATTGQNAVSQAKLFDEALGVTGLVLTKLDGTAKGGIVAAICSELNIPLAYIGIGEQIDDLRPFDPEQFVDALF